MVMTPQYFHTIPKSCAILPTVPTMPCDFLICVNGRLVEGSEVDKVLHGLVVHVDMHGEVMVWVAVT